MIYLYDLLNKIDNKNTAIAVDNMSDAVMIHPEGDKNVFLQHFDDCCVESIAISYSRINNWIHTHIYVSGVYKS